MMQCDYADLMDTKTSTATASVRELIVDKAVLNNDYANLRYSNAWVNLRSLITPEGRFSCQLGQCVPKQNPSSSTTRRSYTEATSVVHQPIPEQWNHTSSIQRSYTEAVSAVPRTTPGRWIHTSSSTTQVSYTEAASAVPRTTPDQWIHTSSIPRSYTEASGTAPHTTSEQGIHSSSDQGSYTDASSAIPQTTTAMPSFASPPKQSVKGDKTSKMDSFPNKSTMKQAFPWKKWFIGISAVCGLIICILFVIILKCYLVLKRNLLPFPGNQHAQRWELEDL